MRIINLECNILYLLGRAWRRSGTAGPFDLGAIYKTFADIPEENLDEAITVLKGKRWLTLNEKREHIFLTPQGIAEMKSFQHCLRDTDKGTIRCIGRLCLPYL
jgi:hypothetical protein